MKKLIPTLIIGWLIGLAINYYITKEPSYKIKESRIVSHIVSPQERNLHFYWKDSTGNNYVDFENLKTAVEKEGKKLIFAMNGGMYQKDLSPQGLYIEQGRTLTKLDTLQKGYGNFYLQPNGVFYLTKDHQAVVCTSRDFKNNGNIQYATQSGPMLLIDGEIHPKFNKGSSNLQIRNGVGILANGEVLFAMSREKINFYDFATFFKQKGCQNALYLDGFVSKIYLPSRNWTDMASNFGVIIAEIENEEK